MVYDEPTRQHAQGIIDRFGEHVDIRQILASERRQIIDASHCPETQHG